MNEIEKAIEEVVPYLDDIGSKSEKLGRRIYHDALSGRRGFRDDQIGIDSKDEIWSEIFEEIGEAALRAMQERQSCPDGFVCVPVEPTEKMKHAGSPCIGPRLIDGKGYAEACYRAMLAAAPKIGGDDD